MLSLNSKITSDLNNELENVTKDLMSKHSQESINRDPYWPKWNSPWWKMTLLMEMGETSRIPSHIFQLMLQKLNSQYLHFFPVVEKELPEGCDPYRDIICHCALGTFLKLCALLKIDAAKEMNWVFPWFEKYQLPDGGYNCDEAVYTKETPRSSFLSTLPVLEALLEYGESGLSSLSRSQHEILKMGANYLLKRKLFRSISKEMKIISQSWLEPVFPRFYHYDILRGLTFLTRWALFAKERIPVDEIENMKEAVSILNDRIDGNGRISSPFRDFTQEGTLKLKDDGKWEFAEKADLFPLLQTASSKEVSSYFLTKEWLETKKRFEIIKNS